MFVVLIIYAVAGFVAVPWLAERIADRFARAFLDRFLEGRRVAETLWQLRQEFLAEGDPLALAEAFDAQAALEEIETLTAKVENLTVAVDKLRAKETPKPRTAAKTAAPARKTASKKAAPAKKAAPKKAPAAKK